MSSYLQHGSRHRPTGSDPSGGIFFDVDNVGDWLEIETTGLVADAFSQPNAAAGLETQFGMALNIENGLILTAPPDSFFNSGNPILDIEHDILTGDLGGFGQLIRIKDATPGGSNTVTGEQIIVGANGSEAVTGLTIESDMGSSGTSDAFGVSVIASNAGSGREVALSAAAGVHQTGANALCLLCTDATDTSVFEVHADGTVVGGSFGAGSSFDGGSA